MGCDIHLHGEVKKDGQWHHVWHGDCDRNYRIFALLADVRNNGYVDNPIPTKGIPSDTSYGTKALHEYWFGDAHSASWLDITDIPTSKKIRESLSPSGPVHDMDDWYFISVIDCLEKHIEQGAESARIVFWFDN